MHIFMPNKRHNVKNYMHLMYETNQLNRGWQIGSYQSVDIMVSEFSTFLCLQGQIGGKV
jgi:hypothetical protein